MSKFVKKTSRVIGQAPGTLTHIGNNINEDVKITLIEYNENLYDERKLESIEECYESRRNKNVKWVNVDAIDKVDIIAKVGEEFNFHPLMLEDILNSGQRPKYDDYEDYVFIVMKMLYYNEQKREITAEQISFVIAENFVFSFQEFEGDVFDNVRERLRGGRRNIRNTGPDYLAYALIDAIVDSYFIILEKIGDESDRIEEELVDTPSKQTMQSIHKLRREIIYLRNSIWPLREVVSALLRDDETVFKDNTLIYLRDVYDHIIQIIDTVETYRDMTSGMLDTYLSSISNKTNDVMKVLTIFSTTFIPLTFIAGVYGMNFDYFPELHWKGSYIGFWVVCAIIFAIMMRYFRKKDWI